MIRIHKQLLFTIFFICISLTKAYSEDTILSFRIVHPEHDKLSTLAQSEVKIDKNRYECFVKENENYWVDRNIAIDIYDLKDAKITIMVKEAGSSEWKDIEVTPKNYASFHFEPSSKPCSVNIYLNKKGREKMVNVTKKNIGRRLAIIFQGKLLMVPIIREKIDYEYVKISGLSFDEATVLKNAITRLSK